MCPSLHPHDESRSILIGPKSQGWRGRDLANYDSRRDPGSDVLCSPLCSVQFCVRQTRIVDSDEEDRSLLL